MTASPAVESRLVEDPMLVHNIVVDQIVSFNKCGLSCVGGQYLQILLGNEGPKREVFVMQSAALSRLDTLNRIFWRRRHQYSCRTAHRLSSQEIGVYSNIRLMFQNRGRWGTL